METNGFPDNVDEDKYYAEGAQTYVIQKEIQTRSGESRTYDAKITETTREAALFMFNENLNWRLDFLGRFILSQKKKVRMNHKVTMINRFFIAFFIKASGVCYLAYNSN